MLGVVLRELEGATPGLQDVPAIEVQEVKHLMDRFLKASFFGEGCGSDCNERNNSLCCAMSWFCVLTCNFDLNVFAGGPSA